MIRAIMSRTASPGGSGGGGGSVSRVGDGMIW